MYGADLANLRSSIGLSVPQFGKLLGLSRIHVWTLEKKRKDILLTSTMENKIRNIAATYKKVLENYKQEMQEKLDEQRAYDLENLDEC